MISSTPVALIINLKKRKDRWDKFKKRLTEIDSTFISKYYRIDAEPFDIALPKYFKRP